MIGCRGNRRLIKRAVAAWLIANKWRSFHLNMPPNFVMILRGSGVMLRLSQLRRSLIHVAIAHAISRNHLTPRGFTTMARRIATDKHCAFPQFILGEFRAKAL